MRVCFVTHQFLPDNMAGVEIYVHRLARSLIDAGHEAVVYSTRKDLTRRDNEVFDEEWDGVPVRRVVRNLFHDGFSRTFDDPGAEAAFRAAVLDGLAPDVVHFHHLIHHSMGLPELARDAGIPVLFTLHDYWLQCPRFGRLLRWDDGICHEVELDRCSQCLQTFGWRNPPRLKTVASGLRGLRRATGLDVQRPLQRIFRSFGSRTEREPATPQVDAGLVAELERRRTAVRERLIPHVDRFLCPSLFLRDRFAAFGLPADRLAHHPYGVPRPAPDWKREPGDGPTRFAFCGSVLPHKGPHVLLEAFAELRRTHGPDACTLQLHGGWDSNPTYGERIEARGAELGVAVTGGYGPDRVDALLAHADCLVVPSIWFENQPITILDARVRGIPVIASDLGGMIELVTDPELRFRVGDPVDLARAMRAFLAGRPAFEDHVPPTPDEDLDGTLKEYAAAVR